MRAGAPRRAAAGVLSVLLTSPVAAQEFRPRGIAPGGVASYVLALSWSPAYCEGPGGGRNARPGGQCAPGANPGFVLHGLWPQRPRGEDAYCRVDAPGPSRGAMEVAREAYPSEGLARYQWRKHGTCSGLDPRAYFSAAREVTARVALPDLPARAAPIEIERAFTALNPGLRADMVSVTCPRGTLAEVRICLTADLRGYAPCGGAERRGCRAREVRVPRG